MITKKHVLLAWIMITMVAIPFPVSAASPSKVYPSFSIASVSSNVSVTIHTYNFPASNVFDVLMGPIGTQGVGGIWVTRISSGAGGSFSATFSIPAALRDLDQIAIRLQSASGSGYYAYNWFANSSIGYYPYPHPIYWHLYQTFSIASVSRDSSVTITTSNLPAHDHFNVMMNFMGTHGVNGYLVAGIHSGTGGSQTFTFNIPPALYGQYQIAIRMQSSTGSGYYAYNWFYNNTAY